MQHGARAVLGKQPRHERAVANIALHKDVARIAFQGFKVGKVARVGQRVEVEHRLIARCQPVEYEIAADEAGTASNKNHGRKKKMEKTLQGSLLAPIIAAPLCRASPDGTDAQRATRVHP